VAKGGPVDENNLPTSDKQVSNPQTFFCIRIRQWRYRNWIKYMGTVLCILPLVQSAARAANQQQNLPASRRMPSPSTEKTRRCDDPTTTRNFAAVRHRNAS
jgi:hypothetical protein